MKLFLLLVLLTIFSTASAQLCSVAAAVNPAAVAQCTALGGTFHPTNSVPECCAKPEYALGGSMCQETQDADGNDLPDTLVQFFELDINLYYVGLVAGIAAQPGPAAIQAILQHFLECHGICKAKIDCAKAAVSPFTSGIDPAMALVNAPAIQQCLMFAPPNGKYCTPYCIYDHSNSAVLGGFKTAIAAAGCATITCDPLTAGEKAACKAAQHMHPLKRRGRRV